MLEELQAAVVAVAEQTAGSVVRVGRGRRGGCGVLVAEGRIVTNAHNVHDDGVAVWSADGLTVEADVQGVDIDGDLAVLEAEIGARPLTYATNVVTIGSPVFAVGYASGGTRVTFGLVSGVGRSFRGPRGRRITGSIEHTAPLAPGASGSALVDADGGLLGLNTSRLGNGFCLAMPADATFRSRVEQLAAGERIRRPKLGVAVAPSWVAQRMRAAVGLDERAGLLVREVEAESAAAAAGIVVGDLLVAIGDQPLEEPDDLADAITAAEGTLAVGLVRGNTELELSVPLRAA